MSDGKLTYELVVDISTGKASLKGFEKDAEESGKKTGASLTKGFSSGISGLAKVAVAAGAAVAGALFTKASIQAAITQQNAVNQLNQSLGRLGQFSKETSQDLQDFASQIQRTTTFGDEAVLKNLALAQSIGATAEQSKLAVNAATGLSTALGTDLDSATKQVAATLNGYTRGLIKLAPEIKNLTEDQLKAGAAIDILNAKFGSAATGELKTFDGALKQANNLFGDLLEVIGGVVVNSPFAVAIINKIAGAIGTLIDSLTNLLKGRDVFKDITLAAIEFGQIIIQYVIAPVELLGNAFVFVFDLIKTGVQTTITGFAQIGGVAGKILSAVGVDGLGQGLQDFADSSKATLAEFANDTKDSASNLFDFSISDKLSTTLTEYTDFANSIKETSIDLGAGVRNALPGQAEADSVTLFTLQAGEAFGNLGVQVGIFNKVTSDQMKQIATVFKSSLVNGISGGIQVLTSSLIKGENAFKAFGKFVLTTIADLAIQIGTTTIAAGIAIESIGKLSGTQAIIAGAALIAIGAAIKAFTGGGGSPSGGTSLSGGGASTNFGAPTQIEDRQPGVETSARTAINVNIAGDVLDSDASGTRIVGLINDAFDKQGTVISRNARFA